MAEKNNVTVVAVYTRKSKFTGKGESITNQIQACKEYIRLHIQGEVELRSYVDEGISGKNMDRPQMQKLLQEVHNREIDVLVCYRLDRVSRNVGDFSDLIEELNSLDVSFISVSENFDTRTPMGRAMMYIASVFSQLERETIAERIRDNMYALAKTGRWLGGQTPLGFASEKVVETDEQGKKRSRFRLVDVEEETETLLLIFQKYNELLSLTKLETYLMNHEIRTKNGRFFGRYILRQILTNPVYCVADKRAYQYLKENNYGLYAEEELFDGKHGLIAYNKNNCKGKNQRRNAVEDWVVSVGEHKGKVDSDTWIQTQQRVKANSGMSYRYPRTVDALLSGIVRCGHCGSLMRPKRGRITKAGEVRYVYHCECKEKSHGRQCDMPNLQGNELDRMVVDEVLQLREQFVREYSFLEDVLHEKAGKQYRDAGKNILLRQMEANAKQIETLLDALGRSSSEATTEMILGRIGEITKQQEQLEKQQKEEEKGEKKVPYFNCEHLAHGLLHMDGELFRELPSNKQKDILKEVVKEVIWDGEYATIHYHAEDDPEIRSA